MPNKHHHHHHKKDNDRNEPNDPPPTDPPPPVGEGQPPIGTPGTEEDSIFHLPASGGGVIGVGDINSGGNAGGAIGVGDTWGGAVPVDGGSTSGGNAGGAIGVGDTWGAVSVDGGGVGDVPISATGGTAIADASGGDIDPSYKSPGDLPKFAADTASDDVPGGADQQHTLDNRLDPNAPYDPANLPETGEYYVPPETTFERIQEVQPVPGEGEVSFQPGGGLTEEQDVTPLQFGNTANLENSLDPNLLDPIAPGPTLDTGLVDRIEQSPELVNLLNQDPDLAEALEQDPTHLYQIEQHLGLAEQWWSNDDPSSLTDPSFTDPNFMDPGLTEQPLPDQSTPDESADDLTL